MESSEKVYTVHMHNANACMHQKAKQQNASIHVGECSPALVMEFLPYGNLKEFLKVSKIFTDML